MKFDSEKQLDISYAGDDRFARLLKSSSFFMMLEMHQTRKITAEPQVRKLLECAAASPDVSALLVDDRLLDDSDDGMTELVQEAVIRTGKPVVPVIAGKNALQSSSVGKINRFRSMQIRDFVAVTGNQLKIQENAPLAGDYEDSIQILRMSAETGDDNCMGVTVNPFKYLPEIEQGQYSKLIRKLNNGADFVVAQAGWDMKKYQELLWFLRSRNVMKPLVARVMFWNPEGRLKDCIPGVPVPLAVTTMGGRQDTMLELTALVALGCRYIGYNGVALAGIENMQMLSQLLERIHTLEAQLTDYSSWCTEWNKRYHEISFLPFSDIFAKQPQFYLYGALMDPDVSEYDPITARPAMQTIRTPELKDRMQAKLHAADWPEWIRKTAGKIAGSSEDTEPLAPCLGLNNDECPKRLVWGPCGGSSIDGTCECGGHPCFFERVVRLAVANRQMEYLEDVKE